MASTAPTLQLPWHVHWSPHVKHIVVALVVAIAAIVIWFKWTAHRDQVDHDQANIAHEKTQVDLATATQANQQVVALQAQVAQQNQQITSLRQEVLNAIATRDTATTARQHAEQSDPLGVVASRWSTLVGAADGDIRVGGDGNAIATPDATRRTAQTLEAGATAAADLKDETSLNAGLTQQVDGLNTLVKSMDASAKAQVVLLQDQVASCKADAKVAKDDASKRARRGFWRGLAVGAGAVGAIALRFL